MSTEHPHKDCLAMFEKLSEYLDRELDEVDCREIERHAESCIQCQSCLETLRRTSELCHSLPEHNVPADFSQRLKTLVEELTQE
jgi:anti-sigma factor RsiW